MLLQWSYLFEPYSRNFVQYRQVANLTVSTARADFMTPYVTLPMIFSDSHTYSFLIPKAVLANGTYYEFRLGFSFPEYTYYTNTLIAKTFDINSPFVSSVRLLSTNQSITVSWAEPEYSTGIIGYKLSLLYKTLGNGAASTVSWNVSQLMLLQSIQLPLLPTVYTFECDSSNMNACLSPFTSYIVQISVIRESGIDAPRAFSTATLKTVLIHEAKDTASIYLYGGKVFMSFVVSPQDLSLVDGKTINSTFLSPAFIISRKGDMRLNLTNSVIQSTSSSSLTITFSETEYSILVQQLWTEGFVFTPLFLHYGISSVIPLSTYCLFLLIIEFQCLLIENDQIQTSATVMANADISAWPTSSVMSHAGCSVYCQTFSVPCVYSVRHHSTDLIQVTGYH